MNTKAGGGTMILFVALGAAAMLSSAYAVDFPFAGGDLASDGADGWNGTKPGTSDVAGIVYAGTYTASDDVSFGSMTLKGAGVLLDLSSPTSGKVTLNATSGKAISFSGHGNSAEIRGGFYELNGAEVATCAGWDASRYNNLLISGGAVITNAGTIRITYGDIGTNTGIRLTGGSRLHSKSGGVSMSYGNTKCSHIEITDGSEFYSAAGGFYTDNSAQGRVTSNRVVVTGMGSRFHAGGMYVGNATKDVRFRVADYATADTATFRLGYGSSSTRTRLEVENHASLSVNGTIYFGGSDTTTASTPGGTNTIAVTDGSTMTVNGSIFVGGYLSNSYSCANELTVSNASLSCGKVTLGFQPGATQNVFRLIGKDAAYSASHSGLPYYIFGKGGFCLFEMDASSWTYTLNQLNFGYEAHDAALSSPGNVMRLKNGASLHLVDGAVERDMMIGTRAAASVSNRLEVLSGSSVEARSLLLTSADNSIVVSNGAIFCRGSLSVGYNVADAALITNGTLAVQGETPEIAVTNAVTIINGSTLRFDLPTSGASYAKAPITSKTFKVDATSSLVVDAEAFAAAVRAAEKPSRAVLELVRTTDGVTVPADVLARANAALPDKCYLKVVEDGNVLRLTVVPDAGLVIFVL
ncbi:MAG: hypothetical protein IJG13_12410 [Kiritimatiellae bacterium]|nr:hypothetical protein [Kiritimatiellia bacterium]